MKEKKRSFLKMRALGHTYKSISQDLGVSKQTLINWSKELADEIANLKTIEMEAFQAEYLGG